MSNSLFSNINGFNETAVHNIEETEELFFDMDYENDFTDKNKKDSSSDLIPFEDDIMFA